jgi:hypothetical protein
MVYASNAPQPATRWNQIPLARSEPVTNREKILQQLTGELDLATAHFREAQRLETEIIRQAPTGIPLPDGQQRILQSAKKVKLAFQEYQRVLKRYRAFVADGILPEDAP